MTWPQHKDPRSDREAKAPYNFVPLPEKVLYLEDTPDPERSEVPTQDVYHGGRRTGWFECVLTTETPLYVRCALTPQQFDAREAARSSKTKPPDQPDFFYTQNPLEPVIPGSSLRGMLRALVEIVSYSKVQPVTDKHKLSFRAVAAPNDDPLSEPYENILGKYGRKVKAGYLKKHGGDWVIHPARKLSDLGWPEKNHYLKVKGRQIDKVALPEYIHLDDDDYRPQYHHVSFDVKQEHGKRGKYVRVTNLGSASGGQYTGVLVCSGNMAESGDASSTGRKNHALVLESDPRTKELRIDKQVIEDYLDTLTDFQKQEPFDSRFGCLIEGRPVFYVEQGGRVIAFGHSPNFRVPAWITENGERRAATPLDFVPAVLRDETQTDLAEALFGYVEPTPQDARPIARAGRVYVGDARLVEGQHDVWVSTVPLTPKILASPKPTTFQHYLVQLEPNYKKHLRHYGSATPTETVIRGHKRYWHKRGLQQSDWEESPENIKSEGDTQHTQMKPIRPGIQFRFKLHFENLDDRELGALLWIFWMAAAEGYRLKLGMGKPLGLGSVKVEATLHVTDRRQRYTTLFADSNWSTGEGAVDDIQQQAIEQFEQWILQDRELNPDGVASLDAIPRIRMLRFLLQWPGPDKKQTRYLEIKPNEYKDRPVLPTPQGVAESGGVVSSSATPAIHMGSEHVLSPRPAEVHPVATPVVQEVSHPTTVDEITEGDLLEGKVISVDENRVELDLGVDATGTMGLARLDDLVRTHPYFRETYSELDRPTTAEIYEQEYLGDDLCGTRMRVRVRQIATRHGKKLIKLDFVEWFPD